jgi:hypothetical protein
MLAHYNEYDLQKMRGDDLQRAAEQNSQLQDSSSRPPFYAPALAGVGIVLVEVGSRLQERYTGDGALSSPAKASL